MNREMARIMLPMIEAYANGEEIEFREVGCGDKDWKVLCNDWNLVSGTATHEYRIKPKPREGYVLPNDLHDYTPGHCGKRCIKVREILE